jgi:hypothetical protein
MMEMDNLWKSVQPLLSRLQSTLESNPTLRQELATFAHALGHWLNRSPGPPAAESAPNTPIVAEVKPSEVKVSEPKLPEVRPVEPRPMPEWSPRLRGPEFSTLPDRPLHEDWPLVTLEMLVARCKVKAEAARLVSKRLAGTAPLECPEELDLRARAAALPDCPLWMLGEPPVITIRRVWDELAGAYAAAADAAELLITWSHIPDTQLRSQLAAEILALAAEAQSLLMYAVAETRGVRQDYEQIQLFVRVREATRNERVFLNRYMKREDRAEPSTWPSLIARIAEAIERVKSGGQKDRLRTKALNNLKFKLKKIQTEPGPHSDEWLRVGELLDELTAQGVTPEDDELQDLLLPFRDRFPIELRSSPAVGTLLRIHRLTELPPLGVAKEADAESEPPSPDIEEVAQLLRDRDVVWIGGTPPQPASTWTQAFQLGQLHWYSGAESSAFAPIEREISNPSVAIVLMVANVPEASDALVLKACEKYSTPLVRLPVGSNRNAVARQILTQAGELLRTSRGR